MLFARGTVNGEVRPCRPPAAAFSAHTHPKEPLCGNRFEETALNDSDHGNGHGPCCHTRLNHLIIEFYERLSSWEHDVVREKGLTLPQVHTLEVLGIHGPMPMKELAAHMGITTGTLTVLVDRLSHKDCVRRRPHESDRRSIIVELTATGRELFEEHDRLHMQLTETLTASLSDEERATLRHCLHIMNKAF